jgi:hypothetical protein
LGEDMVWSNTFWYGYVYTDTQTETQPIIAVTAHTSDPLPTQVMEGISEFSFTLWLCV